MSNVSADAGPAAKKPRTEAANDDAIWAQFEFTEDDLAIVDSVSQSFSQRPKSPFIASTCGGSTFQRHHSWSASPNENVLPNLTKSRSESVQPNRAGNGFKGGQISTAFKNRFQANGSSNKSEVKSWNGNVAFGDQKLSGVSLQEVERQKQELKKLQDEKIKYEELIKQMNDSLSRKDFEIQAIRNEVDSFKQQSVIKDKRQHEHEQEIARLKTELDFKRQELASEQWNVCQQQHTRSNNDNSNKRFRSSSSFESQSRQNIFKSPLKVSDGKNFFPSQTTFSKRIALKKSEAASEITGKSATTSCSTKICQNLNDSVLQLKRPLGIETGPGLVDFLLQQTEIIQPFSAGIVSKIIDESNTRVGHGGLNSQGQSPKNRLSPTTNSSQEVHCDPSSVDIMTGVSMLLKDDDTFEVNGNVRVPLVPPDLNIFKTCLGMRLDCAKSLLPSIDKALSSSLHVGNATLVISKSATHCSNSPKLCTPTAETFNTSVQNTINALKILKKLVYCSPGVCHCLIHKKALIVQTTSENVLDYSNPQPGTSFAPVVQDLDYDKQHSFHPIVQNLFNICCQPLQLQGSLDASLLQLTLEILGTIASYCPFDELPRFLPLITPHMLQNCSSLVLGGSIFAELISLLTILCSNTNIVEASCSIDDSCFWISISSAWQAARKELSHGVMSKLDNLMIQLLSVCLIHEGVKPPFLSTDELHCQFEVISGLVLYLHNQLMLYEECPNLLSIPTLRNGVSLLHQVATRDADFRHHRAQVNFEMFTFLHWLARVKTVLKIGPAADLLLEMWSIKEHTSCEDKEEDLPWTT